VPPHPLRDTGTPEYQVLAASLRRFLDVAIDARSLDAHTLLETAHALDHVTDGLVAARDALPHDDRFIPFDGQRVPMPAWSYDYDVDGGAFTARGMFTNGHTGPPGTVHGGWVAFAFDEVLGWANVQAGYPSMTGKLTIRYRKPTPIGVPVEFRVPPPRVDGKRVLVRATLTVLPDSLTAEAEGLFVYFARASRAEQG
jgi:acyl-coenzyme A thioesterase PaaI-like protein